MRLRNKPSNMETPAVTPEVPRQPTRWEQAEAKIRSLQTESREVQARASQYQAEANATSAAIVQGHDLTIDEMVALITRRDALRALIEACRHRYDWILSTGLPAAQSEFEGLKTHLVTLRDRKRDLTKALGLNGKLARQEREATEEYNRQKKGYDAAVAQSNASEIQNLEPFITSAEQVLNNVKLEREQAEAALKRVVGEIASIVGDEREASNSSIAA